MNPEELAIYQKATGRTVAPVEPFKEVFLIVGRRGGKSLVASLILTYLAAFVDWSGKLAPGEVGTLMLLASDKRQARVCFSYITAFFKTPMLKSLVANELKESLHLKNGIVIEIHTSSFKATRGYTLCAVLADEVAFWLSEGTNPSAEVLNALRPGLATTGGLLLAISSPYGKSGPLYENFCAHFGKDSSQVLVWKETSRQMNPDLPAKVVETALLRDRAAAASEYLAEFRDDIGGFLSVEEIERVVVPGRVSLPPVRGVKYKAFCDPSGGRNDAMVLGIAHAEKEIGVLDLLVERKSPFSPAQIVQEFAAVLKNYRLFEVTGDRYSAEWVAETFEKQGIRYIASDKNRSELYMEFLPCLTSGQI